MEASGFWFYNFEYERERERGLDSSEDLYSPFLLRFDLAGNSSAAIVASTEAALDVMKLSELGSERSNAAARIVPLLPRAMLSPPLTAAADQFIVARGRSEIGDRRLSVVRRLGPRHDDLAARPDAGDRPL